MRIINKFVASAFAALVASFIFAGSNANHHRDICKPYHAIHIWE
jgi:hypothetical protein